MNRHARRVERRRNAKLYLIECTGKGEGDGWGSEREETEANEEGVATATCHNSGYPRVILDDRIFPVTGNS
jgi:hypothetical protein